MRVVFGGTIKASSDRPWVYVIEVLRFRVQTDKCRLRTKCREVIVAGFRNEVVWSKADIEATIRLEAAACADAGPQMR
jgi:hypothetical protein